jgi:hypothetical protein
VLNEIGKGLKVLEEYDDAAFYFALVVGKFVEEYREIQGEACEFLIKYNKEKGNMDEAAYYEKESEYF